QVHLPDVQVAVLESGFGRHGGGLYQDFGPSGADQRTLRAAGPQPAFLERARGAARLGAFALAPTFLGASGAGLRARAAAGARRTSSAARLVTANSWRSASSQSCSAVPSGQPLAIQSS